MTVPGRIVPEADTAQTIARPLTPLFLRLESTAGRVPSYSWHGRT